MPVTDGQPASIDRNETAVHPRIKAITLQTPSNIGVGHRRQRTKIAQGRIIYLEGEIDRIHRQSGTCIRLINHSGR